MARLSVQQSDDEAGRTGDEGNLNVFRLRRRTNPQDLVQILVLVLNLVLPPLLTLRALLLGC